MNRSNISRSNSIQKSRITNIGRTLENKQNFSHLDHNITENLQSIKGTIQMLKQYQYLCIQKQDFMTAQQTKNKIQFLQLQQKAINKQRGILKQQQHVEIIWKQGEEEVQKFQNFWDSTIKHLIFELKQIQTNAIKQHETQLQKQKQKIQQEENPSKIKYSPKVLELRKNLANLIKVRKYMQAEEVKNKLKQLQLECESQWNLKNIERKRIYLQKIQKRQAHELKALRVKLQGIFNQKIKQRDHKFEILLKRNRKRKIESSKSCVLKQNQTLYWKSANQSIVLKESKKLNI